MHCEGGYSSISRSAAVEVLESCLVGFSIPISLLSAGREKRRRPHSVLKSDITYGMSEVLRLGSERL